MRTESVTGLGLQDFRSFHSLCANCDEPGRQPQRSLQFGRGRLGGVDAPTGMGGRPARRTRGISDVGKDSSRKGYRDLGTPTRPYPPALRAMKVGILNRGPCNRPEDGSFYLRLSLNFAQPRRHQRHTHNCIDLEMVKIPWNDSQLALCPYGLEMILQSGVKILVTRHCTLLRPAHYLAACWFCCNRHSMCQAGTAGATRLGFCFPIKVAQATSRRHNANSSILLGI